MGKLIGADNWGALPERLLTTMWLARRISELLDFAGGGSSDASSEHWGVYRPRPGVEMER
jgi:hypothetical protein